MIALLEAQSTEPGLTKPLNLVAQTRTNLRNGQTLSTNKTGSIVLATIRQIRRKIFLRKTSKLLLRAKQRATRKGTIRVSSVEVAIEPLLRDYKPVLLQQVEFGNFWEKHILVSIPQVIIDRRSCHSTVRYVSIFHVHPRS